MTVQTLKAPLSRFAAAALCAATLLLGACSNQELYTQLSERQANEMMRTVASELSVSLRVAQVA